MLLRRRDRDRDHRGGLRGPDQHTATSLAGPDLTNLWGFILAGEGFETGGADQGLSIQGIRNQVEWSGTQNGVTIGSHSRPDIALKSAVERQKDGDGQ